MTAGADFFDDAHHHTDREVILMTAVAVSAYVCAAAAGCSGTLAVFFCGITMSHYTWHSISASARVMSGAPHLYPQHAQHAVEEPLHASCMCCVRLTLHLPCDP